MENYLGFQLVWNFSARRQRAGEHRGNNIWHIGLRNPVCFRKAINTGAAISAAAAVKRVVVVGEDEVEVEGSCG